MSGPSIKICLVNSMTDTSIVNMRDTFGPFLMGRADGARARGRVQELHAAGSQVRVDFTGVELMTPGFADEFFGRLPADALDAGEITVESLAPSLTPLLRLVSSRAAARRAATAA